MQASPGPGPVPPALGSASSAQLPRRSRTPPGCFRDPDARLHPSRRARPTHVGWKGATQSSRRVALADRGHVARVRSHGRGGSGAAQWSAPATVSDRRGSCGDQGEREDERNRCGRPGAALPGNDRPAARLCGPRRRRRRQLAGRSRGVRAGVARHRRANVSRQRNRVLEHGARRRSDARRQGRVRHGRRHGCSQPDRAPRHRLSDSLVRAVHRADV